MSKTIQHRILRAIVVLLISIALFVFLYINIKAVLSGTSITDTEADENAIQQTLKLAQSHQTGSFPDSNLEPSIHNAFIEYYLKDNPKCWNAIQDFVSKNGNKYIISASDPFRELGRDVDNSVVEVQFENGNKIAFTFYQQRLVGCTFETGITK